MANKKNNGGGGTGGESSLRSLVAELRQESSDNGDLIVSTNFILSNISNNIADMTMATLAIHQQMTSDKMAQLEKENETNKFNEKLLEALKKKPEEKQKEKGSGSWLGLAAAILSGLVAGAVQFVKEYLNSLKNAWTALTKAFKIDGLIATLINKIKAPFIYLKNVLGKWDGALLKWLDDFVGNAKGGGLIRTFKVGIINLFTRIGNIFGFSGKGLFKDFVKVFDSVGDMFNMIMEPIRKIFSGGGKGMFSFVDDILKGLTFFKPITQFFKSIGGILGKLAFPIQVIMSIWDTVSGAIDGWKNTEGSMFDKVFGAIKGGLTGLVNGLIGGLLDLLKGGVSFIAELFGAKGFSEWLDSFSFSEILANIVGKVVDFVKGLFTFMGDLFTDPKKALETIGNIGDMAIEGLKKILRALLPTPGASGFAGIAAKLIPDGVYEFAGLDPKTGAVVAKTSETGVPTKALENVSGENKAATAEKEAKAVAAGAAAGMASNSSQTINNNTTQAAIIKSKATNWEPDDQWARGGMPMGA